MDEIKTDQTKIDINNTIKETISVFEVEAMKKGVQISNNVEIGLTGLFDTEHLRIIFRNLLWNAIKYTPSNGTIVFSSKVESDKVKITICDTGIGLSKTDYNNLQNGLLINSTRGTNNETGTGLGLSICKDLLDKNNSRLLIQPNTPVGSCFSILIPK
jgi:signal transduction histidine kinase